MGIKLLFPSSTIFNDADDLDCIHQCDIDLHTRKIPKEEIESLLSNVLEFLKTSVRENIHSDLLFLLFDCFSEYPSELIDYFNTFKERSFESILNFNSTIFILIALNRAGVKISEDFVLEALKIFRDEFDKPNSFDNFQYNGLRFTKENALFSVHNLLRVLPLNEEILKPFIPKLFVDNPNDYRLDLVAHIAASNLLSLIPEKYYLTLDAYINSPSPSLVFSDLVPFMPKDAFFNIAPQLEEYLISLGNPEMSLVFLKKCYETDFRDLKNFQALFSVIDTKYLDQNLLKFISNFEFVFSDKQTSALINFDDTEFYMITLPEPQKYLTNNQIETFFAQCEDPNILRKVLKPLFTHPYLMKVENWARFIKLIDSKDFSLIGKCFISNSIDIGEMVINLLIHESFDNKVCNFLRTSLNKDHRDAFVGSPRLNELLSTIDKQPPFSFWRIFSKSRCLITYVVDQNFRCPYVMYGLVTVTSFTKLDPFFQTIYIEPQTPESLKKVEEYINRTCINKTALFTSVNAGPIELSLMAAGHYYGTRVAYHQTKAQYEGLNVNNIIHFTIVASMTYKVTSRLHASPVFLEMFTDENWYSMTLEALKLISNDLKEIYFEHLLSAMPTLYLFNSFISKLRPLILDMLKTKDYDQKQMVLFLCHLSHSTASPTVFLRRSLIKDPALTSLAKNEPNKKTLSIVREEEKKFWDEIGEEALEIISTYDFSLEFPLNFHCDCLKGTGILENKMKQNPTAKYIKLIQNISISPPKFELLDSEVELIYNILEEEIEKSDWLNCQSIIHFLCKIEKTDGLMPYFKRGLPMLNLALTTVFKSSDTQLMRDNCSVDFVISIMCSQARIMDIRVRNFVERILNDEDTLILYYIQMLQRLPRNFCVHAHSIATIHWDDICRNPKLFGVAVNTIYCSPSIQPSILILRPKPLPTNPPSQFSIRVIRKMMNTAFNEEHSHILCWATFFIQSHGFLLLYKYNKDENNNDDEEEEDFNHIKIFEKVMGILKEFGNSKSFGEFKASLTTIAFLYFYLTIPQVIDLFFEWFFALRNEFNENQIYVFLLILITLLSIDSVKTVTASVLVRYDFLNFVPKQYNAKEYSVVIKLFLDAVKQAVETDFYTFDALCSCKEPFLTAYDNQSSLHRLMTQSNPLSLIMQYISEDDQTFVSMIIRDRFYHREAENADSRVLENILSDIKQNSSNAIDENDFIPSPWASKEAFQNLPQQKLSTILHHMIPKLPSELTPKMLRYLAIQPKWISSYLKSPSTLLLLPIHYKEIYEMIENLHKIERNEIDVESNFFGRTRSDFPKPDFEHPHTFILEYKKSISRSPRSPYVISPPEKEDFVPKLIDDRLISQAHSCYSSEYIYNFRLTDNEIVENNNICVERMTRSSAETIEITFFSQQLFQSLLTVASFGNINTTNQKIIVNSNKSSENSNDPASRQEISRPISNTTNENNNSNANNANDSNSNVLMLEFSELLESIGNYGPALTSILDHISSILEGISNGNLISVVRILVGLSKSNSFVSTFSFALEKPIMSTVCSPQFRLSTVLFTTLSKIFDNFPNQLPEYVLQVVEQMLLSGGNCFTASLVPYSKLNSSQKKIISKSIEVSFASTLNSSLTSGEVMATEILAYLKTVPEIMAKYKEQLLQILNKLLERYTPDNNEIIIKLFAIVSPKKDDLIFKNRNDSPEVPQEVKDKNPYFWETVINYSTIISKLVSSKSDLINDQLYFVKSFPALLDFPIRASLFNKACKSKISNRPLIIQVRRNFIIEDSFAKLDFITRDMLLSEIKIKFIEEQGVDMGGLKKDWFTTLVRALFNPEYALFTKDREPNPSSSVNKDHLRYFNFTGKIIARAVIDGVNLDCHLPTVLCKEILGIKPVLRDLEVLDPELFRSLQWMLDNDVTGLDMTFTAPEDNLGEFKEVPLVKGGENKAVTNENKKEFVDLMIKRRLIGRTSQQVKSFVSGFHFLISKDELKMFSPSELDLIICGIPTIDICDMRENCKYEFPLSKDHPSVQRFFAVIRHWNREDLAKLLLFVTGSSQLPIGGFKTFKDEGNPFTIAPGGDHTRLPAAHTCTNTLDLPEYQSEKELNEKLLFSIKECDSFGFQ